MKLIASFPSRIASNLLRYGCGLLLATVCSLSLAQIVDPNNAVNKAGRQRMLSQRMAKAYLQLGLDVQAPQSRAALDNSIALFDRQLVELKNYAPTAEIRATYLQLEKAWLAYKDVLIGSVPSQANAYRVVELSDEVLALAQQGTTQLEAYAKSSSTHLVNVSGRQRMLSQRLAKLYLADAWRLSIPKVQPEIDKTRKEFNDGLRELVAAPTNTAALQEELRLLGQQWIFFENALNQRGGTDKNLPTHVATSSERILQLAEHIVDLYEKAPGKQ